MNSSASSFIPDRSAEARAMVFGRAHCLAADGPLTPPSSPDTPRQKSHRTGPRLHFSKLPRRPKMLTKCPSSDAVAPIGHHYELMAKLLPESPAATNCSSTSTISPVEPPELRRVSASYHDLRSFASHQCIPMPPQPTTPLLSSPITHELCEEDGAYFQFRNPRLPRDQGDYQSYEDLHILSCYYDESKAESLEEIMRELEENSHEANSSCEDEASDTTGSENLQRTPKQSTPRQTLCSEEADWLANSTTPNERLRRFKARCYQEIEYPLHGGQDEKTANSIRLATLKFSVPPGRPRLVQITRAASRTSTEDKNAPKTPRCGQSEISAFSLYDTPGLVSYDELESDATATHPATELPASLYSSTSLVPQPLSLLRPSFRESSCLTFSKTRGHLNSLTDPFATSNPLEEGKLSAQNGIMTTFPDSDSDYLHTTHARSSHSSPTPSKEHPRREYYPRASQRNPYGLHHVLFGLETAIQTFTYYSSHQSPSTVATLDLSSPMILDLRCPNIPSSQYISILGKIFPSTHDTPGQNGSLLSALAAWIIVDLRLCSHIRALQAAIAQQLNDQEQNALRRCANVFRSRLSRPPNLQFFPPPPSHHRDCPCCPDARRENLTGVDQLRRYEYSFTTLINQSSSSLHRIPTKARDLLGIIQSPDISNSTKPDAGVNGSGQPSLPTRSASTVRRKPLFYPNQQSSDTGEASLLRKTIATQASVSVVAKKLVETLRGDSGFDEDIWRALRVLIEVVEEGGWTRRGEQGGTSEAGKSRV